MPNEAPAERRTELMRTAMSGRTDCIILSGGFSQRLWPLTINLSKHLLPVGGRPVLAYAMDFVMKSTLVDRVFLLTSPKYAAQTTCFRDEYMRAHDSVGAELIIEPDSTPGDKIGPIGAIAFACQKIQPENLLVVAGDNLFEFNLDDLLRSALESGRSAIALHRLESHEDTSEYGVAELGDSGQIVDFREKAPTSTCRNISTGCYFFNADDVKRLGQYLESGGNPDSLGSFVQWLVTSQAVLDGYVFTSAWFDIGTRDKLLQANARYLRDERHHQTDDRSEIEAPVQTEPGCTLRNSKIGPNVFLGSKVHVCDSEIRDALVMSGSVIRHGQVVNSIIGPGSMVEGLVSDSILGPESQAVAPNESTE